jgi:hypothetical protein
MNDLGEFTMGEKPIAQLLHTFLDATGLAPIANLTGYQARFTYRERYGSPATRTASIQDGPAAKVAYVFDGTEMATPGQWQGELWVGNGSVRVASTWFRWRVRASAGTVPNI